MGKSIKDIEYINNKLWKIQDVEDGRKATNPTKGRPAPGTRKAVLAQQQAQPSLLSYFAQKMREQHEFDLKPWDIVQKAKKLITFHEAQDRHAQDVLAEEDSRLRRNAITDKLEVVGGFTITDFADPSWKKNSIINAPEPLTDQVWNQIKSQVLKVIERGRQKRAAAAKVIRKRSDVDHYYPSTN